MRNGLAIVLPALLVLSAAPVAGAAEDGTVHRDLEGRRAFADLARHYEHPDSLPPDGRALEALAGPSSLERRAAGRYLLRLFEQSLADETNGRARWGPTPYWGGGATSPALEFRDRLAEDFGNLATGTDALPALQWLLWQEPWLEHQAHAVPVLPRLSGPAAEELFAKILREPHPSSGILLETIRAARAQRLESLVPELRRLCRDHRAFVRQAAADALVGLGAVEAVTPARIPFPQWLADALHRSAARVLTPVPPQARWGLFIVETGAYPPVRRIRGWLIAEEDTAWFVLDEFAREQRLSRRHTRLVPQTLAEEAARLVALRDSIADPSEAADSLSAEGGLTGQFESRDLSLPEILVAAWSLERGDTSSASAILFPRVEALGHEHRFDAIARTRLGDLVHHRMLEAFSYDRDYPRTMALADHLSRSLFDGYAYQPRARELRMQLASRQSDFHGFALPDSVEWESHRRRLDRAGQIVYLTERLRLLNAFQWMQPGGVHLGGAQYEEPSRMSRPFESRENRSRRLVNPYSELKALGLTPGDIPHLAPALADLRFLPTFSFWRDFHPSRTLYRVCDVVAWIIDDVAEQVLVDPDSIPALSPEERRTMVRRVSDWGRARAGMSPDDLRLEILRTTDFGPRFRVTADQAIKDGDVQAISVLVERFEEFPQQLTDFLEIASRTKSAAFVPIARKHLTAPVGASEAPWQATYRLFYSGLILLRNGEREGLVPLRKVLVEDEDGTWMQKSYEDLLASGDAEARGLLCGAVRKSKLVLDDHNDAMLRRLLREGCPGVADTLLARLGSEKPHGKAFTTNPQTGEPMERNLVEGDFVAEYVTRWRPGAGPYDKGAPDDERRRRRIELHQWLTGQVRRLEAGEAVEMRP